MASKLALTIRDQVYLRAVLKREIARLEVSSALWPDGSPTHQSVREQHEQACSLLVKLDLLS